MKVKRIGLILILSWLTSSWVLAEELHLPSWEAFMEDFATATVSASALSTLPASLGSVVPFLLEADDVSRVLLLTWLHRKSVDAVSAEQWEAHKRYEAFFNCLAIQLCDELSTLLETETGKAEASSGWIVREDRPIVPPCANDLIAIDVPGDKRFIYHYHGGNEAAEVIFSWSEPFYEDNWLWIELKLEQTSRPIAVSLVATFEHSGTFKRRMASFPVGAAAGWSTYEVPGIFINDDIDEVSVTLDFAASEKCGVRYEGNQIQRYVMARE